jgi:hypothetical protein
MFIRVRYLRYHTAHPKHSAQLSQQTIDSADLN